MEPAQKKYIVRTRLKLKSLEAQNKFKKSHPHAHDFFQKANFSLSKVRQHSAKLLTAGSLGGALLLSPGSSSYKPLSMPEPIVKTLSDKGAVINSDPKNWLIKELHILLPPITNRFSPPFLTYDDEKVIEKVVETATGIPARASVEGEHLNTTYGYIGAEQHLARFPGDTIAHHEMRNEGMAPGLGAWGYFTNSEGKLTQDAIMREKYYVAVQTLYLPDWNKRVKYLYNWYKYRKVLVVNPENGSAVTAVVGDAGPAAWTGKHFGGSPEVMFELGGKRYKKGRVLLFFVDDPQNKIPLGPVNYDITNNLPAGLTTI